MRKMGIDLGDARIGIALSDTMGIIASPYETYKTRGQEQDVDYIINIASIKQCDTIVIGYPINMDGSIGPRAEKSKQYAEAIKLKSDIKVVLQDERMTTQSAERFLIQADMRRDKRKTVIDQVAACIILRQYLERI